eukprot:1922936-Pyramimonas_sp.AAC.1
MVGYVATRGAVELYVYNSCARVWSSDEEAEGAIVACGVRCWGVRDREHADSAGSSRYHNRAVGRGCGWEADHCRVWWMKLIIRTTRAVMTKGGRAAQIVSTLALYHADETQQNSTRRPFLFLP